MSVWHAQSRGNPGNLRSRYSNRRFSISCMGQPSIFPTRLASSIPTDHERRMKLTMSSEDALGLLRKSKSESTPIRSVAVVVGGVVTANFRGCISEADNSRLILTQDPTTNLVVNWLAHAARFEYRDVREVSPEDLKHVEGERIDSVMKIHTSSVLVTLYVMEGY